MPVVGEPVLAKEKDPEDVGAAAREADQYGATEPIKDKLPLPSNGIVLHLCMGTYIFFFAVFTLADIAYITSVDARFPAGLGYLYPSTWEREQAVTYVRQTLTVQLCGRMAFFCLVMSLVYFELYAKVDKALCQLWMIIGEKWESSGLREAFHPWMNCMNVGLTSCYQCCCCCSKAPRAWHELLHGAIYLTLFAMLFELLQRPFANWAMMIDFDFGFTNALTIAKPSFWDGLFDGLLSAFITGVAAKWFLLALLQFRLGWLFMWGIMTILVCIVQLNSKVLAPMMTGGAVIFPNSTFLVGRGFQLETTDHKSSPQVSLNRIYFEDSAQEDSKQADSDASNYRFATHDHSKGQLLLGLNKSSQSWFIGESTHDGPVVYAKVHAPALRQSASELLDSLDGSTWNPPHQSGRIGVRSGSELRQKLFGFAKQAHVNISQIVLIDGSYQDARANAFAMGAEDSVIGLYDTLFLGDHKRDAAKDAKQTALQRLRGGESAINFFSHQVQGVGSIEKDDPEEWHSAPTQAMTDDEIVAILGHELGHSAMGHLHTGMWTQALTSFATFAALGWTTQSPALAATLGLAGPVLWVGACVYEHLLSPSLDKTLKLITDWQTRQHEYQADAYAAKLGKKYAVALQTGLAKLTVNSNQDPDMPIWYEVLHTDHPSTAHRWASIEQVKEETYGSDHK